MNCGICGAFDIHHNEYTHKQWAKAYDQRENLARGYDQVVKLLEQRDRQLDNQSQTIDDLGATVNVYAERINVLQQALADFINKIDDPDLHRLDSTTTAAAREALAKPWL